MSNTITTPVRWRRGRTNRWHAFADGGQDSLSLCDSMRWEQAQAPLSDLFIGSRCMTCLRRLGGPLNVPIPDDMDAAVHMGAVLVIKFKEHAHVQMVDRRDAEFWNQCVAAGKPTPPTVLFDHSGRDYRNIPYLLKQWREARGRWARRAELRDGGQSA